MKGAVLALFCAVVLANAEINENGCPINPYVDALLPHPNCNKFYQCLRGELIEHVCASNLVFNVETQECDWSENVDCETRLPPVVVSSEETENSGNGGGDNGDGNGDNGAGEDNNSSDSDSGNGDVDSGNGNPSEAPEICAAEGSDGVLVAHENCNQFYKCSEGKPVALDCPSNLLYNPSYGYCDWPQNVDCNGRNPDGGNGGDGNEDSGNEDGENGDGGNGDGGNGDGGNGNNGDGGNSNPSEAPEICAADGSDGVLVAHENCNQFYKCSEGKPVALDCPLNLLYNPSYGYCDWPENVDCDGRNPDGGNGGDGNGDGGNGDGGNGDGGNGDSGNGGGDNGSNGDGGNSNPSEAPEICAADGSDGVLVAHENCNQFYKCSEGKPVALDCPSNLLYNPSYGYCDWPQNVDCDGRNPDGGNGGDGNEDGGNGDGGNGDGGNGGGGNGDSGNGGSDNGNNGDGGNSNPSEAPEICAADGSDGVLVAHENCNQFYKCFEGKPVALDCPSNLLYNPSYGYCDWPQNVDCDGRNPDGGNGGDGNEDGGNGDGGNGDGDGGNGDSGNGGGDNGNNGDSGNSNPNEAPEICAADGSNGVLVAHENCNQFYSCFEGKPVALDCPLNLLYNPYHGYCDWPENVDCDGRNLDGGNGGDGNEDGGNEDGGNGDGGNGDGGNGGDDNGNNGGGGNGNPSEAPEICAADGSDGVLVAHENCNQFYKCSEGIPVAFNCPASLLFDPTSDLCDWPENVDCGSRNRFASFNKHMRFYRIF